MKELYPLPGNTHSRYACVRSFFIPLIFILFTAGTGRAQINAYARVTTIAGAQLNISNVNQTYHSFAPGEQVIVMQMQDNVIGSNTSNDSNFGLLSSIANAGTYEVATISSVTSTTMTLTATLQNSYDINTHSRVQVISFAALSSLDYTLASDISAVPWDGNVGGVIAMQVPGTLTLSGSISTNGQGFRGGGVSSNYESNCEPSVYRSNSSNYAYKGEGIYLGTSSNYVYGRARLLTGGGGGSDDNGGGGGGGNYTGGGDGGPGWTCTSANASGGLGGIALGSYVTPNRVFMGGGGGGGQQNNSVGSAGANGGGIILISAQVITTSCSGSVHISANGNAAGTSGNDGAGGAGGGGSIVINASGFSVPSGCPLTIEANGGAGGDVGDANAHGGGGGGGQGAILFSGGLPVTNVTTTANNGQGGLNNIGGTRTASGTGSNNSGVSAGNSTPLPVTIEAFAAINTDNQALLKWTLSGTLVSNETFHVQRAADGLAFSTIGTVPGTNEKEYRFTDPLPAPGRNYYRLQIVDRSGEQKYSGVVSVDINASKAALVAYPNPAHREFTIRWPEADGRSGILTISNLSGKVVYSKSYPSLDESMSVRPADALKPGIYIIRLSSSGTSRFGKLIID